MENIVGATDSKPLTEQRRRSIVIDYLISASTHGLRSVGRAYSTCNRLYWVAVFMIASGFMCYFIVSSVRQYFAYPTDTKVEITLDLGMAFPAVTICSGNPNRYDKVNVSLVDYFYRLYSTNATFNQTVLNSLIWGLYADLFNRNQIQELQGTGFQASDMLLTCSYNGIDCFNSFIPSMSSIFGNCFTFNWKTSTNFVTLANLSDGFVSREGLSMSFYIPREIFFPTSYYDSGLIVLLHDNNEIPLPNENGLHLQSGLSHSISYRKTVTTFLPFPYTRCTTNVSRDFKSLAETTFLNQTASTVVAYSESICRELCEQAYAFSQCSCILPLPFFTRYVLTIDGNLIAANVCNPVINETTCAFSAKQTFAASDQLQSAWCAHCAPQCQHISFDTVLSAEPAPSDYETQYWASNFSSASNETKIVVPNDFAQRFDYYFERNFLKLLVSCGSKYVTEYKQEPKLTIGDTFSAIGGQSGLWIGLSVLSVIELVELVYRLVYKHIVMWISQRKVHRITPVIQIINN